jgi:ComF family protein
MRLLARSVLTRWAGLAGDLVDFVYPPACLLCQAPPGDAPVCPACEAVLTALPSAVCSRCRLFLTADLTCPLGHSDLAVGALGLFDDHYRPLVHALKFHGDLRTGRWLGRRVGRAVVQSGLARQVTAVVPVPLHPTRQRERGYNQSQVIGAEVARALGAPLSLALVRQRDTRSQTELAREARADNVRGAFAARVRLENASVLLVDDVLTTGATLAECAAALQAAGADSVVAATVALAES